MADTTSIVKLPPLPASEEGTSDEEEVPKVYSDEVLDMTNLAAEVRPIVCTMRFGHTLAVTLPYPAVPCRTYCRKSHMWALLAIRSRI